MHTPMLTDGKLQPLRTTRGLRPLRRRLDEAENIRLLTGKFDLRISTLRFQKNRIVLSNRDLIRLCLSLNKGEILTEELRQERLDVLVVEANAA